MRNILVGFFTLFAACLPSVLLAHGGVSLLEDDVCIIKIGFMEAHFAGYQPQVSGHEDFCEDIPFVDESVFVIHYQHNHLKTLPLDFRIVRDEYGLGDFVAWDDLKKVLDIERDTVYYRAPETKAAGVFQAIYPFEKPGRYIGIVSAQDTVQGETYYSVFPFEVGGRDWGFLPVFLVIIMLLQAGYWWYQKHESKS